MSEIVATLTIVGRSGEPRNVPLRDGQTLRIGRHEAAEVQLDDPSVSRSHCMFSASASGVVISDLSSTNGTYVNGKQISIPVDLQATDVIDVGSYKLSVSIGSVDAAEAMNVSGRTMTAQLKPTHTVVLVARLRGVKELELTQPEGSLAPHIAKWRQIVTLAVTPTGGRPDKMLNECVVAIWYGQDVKKISAAAVKAAQQIDVQTRQHSVCGGWPLHDTHPLTCSLVLNTGMALTGSVGGKGGTREFAVLGDTINTAFKLAEVTEPLSQSVFISDEVAAALSNAVRMQMVGSVMNEKEGETVNLFAVQL